MEQALLRLEGITVRFRGVLAVDGIDMAFQTGKIYGLIGTNGAGKSTVINLISGSYRPTAGSILFRGAHIEKLSAHQIARLGVARTFQNLRLFGGLTVMENVVTARQSRHRVNLPQILCATPGFRRTEEALRQEALVCLRQVKLENCAQQRVDSLPYGLQRRLEIARCLAMEPALLLLDEPAAGMNPQESLQLAEDIRAIHRARPGMTILLVEHDMKVVMGLCEYIYTMASGRCIASGTPEEVQSSEDVIRAYLGGRRHA